VRRAFGAKGGIGDYVRKPKWMRWRMINIFGVNPLMQAIEG
jgi:hypothetical protein